MAVKKKERLDALNVAYGIGASVVIIGAMFKFLNYPLANEMLFVGLATEAIVFFISAFELKREEKEYNWERLFPQLTHEHSSPIEQLDEMIQKANLDPMIVERLSQSIQQLEENVSKLSESSATAQLSQQLDRMRVASESFEQEVTKLNQSVAEMNKFYERLLEAMNNKK